MPGGGRLYEMTFRLKTGQTVLIDDADAPAVLCLAWHIGGPGYAKHSYREEGKIKSLYLHTFLTGLKKVDHENRNKLDNRRANIRPATSAQNMANRSKWIKQASSKFKGVSWSKERRKWRAYAGENSKHHIGYFHSEIEAAKAVDMHALALYGEYACLNFPRVFTADDRDTSQPAE